MRIGIASESVVGTSVGVASGLHAAAVDAGLEVLAVASATDEARVELLIALGLPVAYPDLLRRPKIAPRVLWVADPLPAAPRSFGERVHQALPTGRLLDSASRIVPALTGSRRFRAAREVAEREREQHKNARLLKSAASAFDYFAFDTDERVARMARLGLSAWAIPFGYHEVYAGPLTEPHGSRDIDVLFLGRLFTPLARRRRVLESVVAGLAERGVAVEMRTETVSSSERRNLLERSRVVLDIQRMEGTSETFRFVLAAAAGAVLVTEPGDSRRPIEVGRHIVEARSDQMASAIVALLADEPRRLAMAAASRQLLANEMSMGRALEKLLQLSGLPAPSA